MPHDDPRFEIPVEVTAARDRLDDRYYLALGRAISRVVTTVSSTNEQELAAAYLTAMQDTLSAIRRDDAVIVEGLIQQAYAAGRKAGTENIGRQLGMLPKEPPEKPEITH